MRLLLTLYLCYAAIRECVALTSMTAVPRAISEVNRASNAHYPPPEDLFQIFERDALTPSNVLMSRASATCPETVGAPPFPCSSCGGEDPNNKKHCKNKSPGGGHCQCSTADATGTPALTTVTASESGKTATGTYVLQTIAAYSKLRQSLTTTVTSTTTATDGSTGVETAAAVIMAGGVVWFLQSFTGEAAVAESALEAPTNAEDHPDDKRCPDPESKCSDCLALNGMCTTGEAAGCSCEEESCPTGDKQPKCSDPKCEGNDDKKCTNENKGCECTEACPSGDQQPKCSDPICKGDDDKKCTNENKGCECADNSKDCPSKIEETPLCDKCGGNKDGKCIGIKEENDKFKGCLCVDERLKDSDPYTAFDDAQLKLMAKAMADMPEVTDSSYDLSPSDNTPTCLKAGWSAPANDEDGRPGINTSIDEWCESMDGKEVTRQPKGTDTLFKMFPYAYFSYWLSASSWYVAPEENKCGDTSKITKDECISSLKYAIQHCDPDGKSHGASLAGHCLFYNVTLDGSQKDQSPPWNRLPQSAAPQCDMDKPGKVTNEWFAGLYPQFCDEVNKDKAKAILKEMTNKDFKDPKSKRSLWRRAPPPSANSYDGFKFQFDWSGGKDGCRMDCTEAFKTISLSPCGHTGGQSIIMASKASVEAGCGKYSYEIKPKEDEAPPEPEKKCEPTDSDFYMEYDTIVRNTGEFCNKLYELGPKRGGSNHKETYNDGTPDRVDFSANWEGDDKTLYMAVDKEQCNKSLKDFVDGCNAPNGHVNYYNWPMPDSNALNFKHGGSLKMDGITYTFKPTGNRHRPAPFDRPSASCNMWYKGFHNTFDIYGFGRLSADYGKTQLVPLIQKCQLIAGTKVKFDYYDPPQDGNNDLRGAEWHAYGKTIIGPQQWRCVGNAIRAAMGDEGLGDCGGQ